MEEYTVMGIRLPESGLLRAVFRGGARYDICFTGGVAAEEDPSPFPVARMNRFWFVLVQALGKLYRRDYLIAAHLANECINETLVQQMVLRDLTAGTTHHRYGGAERLAWEQYAGCCPYLTGEDGFDRIADRLHAAALAFDDLAPQLQADYLPRYDALSAIWHDYAKALEM